MQFHMTRTSWRAARGDQEGRGDGELQIEGEPSGEGDLGKLLAGDWVDRKLGS
jgi:hypothetical protein